MKRKMFILCGLLLSVCTLSFGNDLKSMDKKAIVEMLSDKTITTIPLSTINNKLVMNRVSIYFDKSGKLEGQFARKPENQPQSDTGTWTVKANGMLCANWQHWTGGKETCVYAYDTKNSLIFTNPASYFDSLVLQQNIKPGNTVHELKSMKQMMREKTMQQKAMPDQHAEPVKQ